MALGRADDLQVGEFEGLRSLMMECVSAGFEPAELKMMEERAAKSTGWSVSVVASVIRDARSHKEDHGVLPDKLSVSTALAKEWRQRHTAVVYTDGGTYFYVSDDHPIAAETPASERGVFLRAATEEEDEEVRQFTAGSPVVQGEAARREVRDTTHSILAVPNFFADAAAGVNCADGFAQWNKAQGRIERVAHSPEHKARVKLAFAYDPAAQAPRFREGLQRVLPEPDRQLALQEFFAAVLFGLRLERDNARAAVILVGEARTGKTSMIEVLESFYPQEAIGHEPPTGWGGEYNRAELAGKVLNTVTELSSGKTLKSDIFKLIVSGETFKARYPREKPFRARFSGYHAFACNALPTVDDESDGFGRRLTVIRFDHPIPVEQISGDFLEVVRRDELAGVLNWAAEAIPGMLARGSFALPACHAEALLYMRHPNDHVAWAAAFHIEAAPGRRIHTADLKDLLRRVHASMGLSGEADGNGEMRRLSAWLKKLYRAQRSSTNNEPYYLGVRLRSEPGARSGEGDWPMAPPRPGPNDNDNGPRSVNANEPDEIFEREDEDADFVG